MMNSSTDDITAAAYCCNMHVVIAEALASLEQAVGKYI